MAVTMALTATSHSITATVSGLDSEYAGKRLFVWFLDRRERERETIQGGDTTHAHTIEPVYFGSLHTVKCEIYNEDGTQLFITLTDTATTGYPSVAAWNWQSSNGTASAMQTAAAYTALAGRGQTANMNYRVWNDLANKIHRIITESGIPWDGKAPPVVASRSELMADDMNLLVKNVGYPVWSWRDDRAAQGYLGRLDFKGIHRYGKQSDFVYGAYIIELAKNLNIIIRIYTNGDGLRYIAADVSTHVTYDATGIARHSAPLIVQNGIIIRDDALLHARHSTPITVRQGVTIGAEAELIAEIIQLLRVRNRTTASAAATLRADQAKQVSAELESSILTNAMLSPLSDRAMQTSLEVSASAEAELIAKHLEQMLATVPVTLSVYGNADRKQVKRASASVGTVVAFTSDANRVLPKFIDGTTLGIMTRATASAAAVSGLSYVAGQGEASVGGSGSITLKEPVTFSASSRVLDLSAEAKMELLPTVSVRGNNVIRLTHTALLETEQPQPPSDWEYPVWETDGLLIRQVNLAYHNQSNKHIQIDWYFEQNIAAACTTAVTAYAKAMASHNWTYPDRLPDRYGRVLCVYQSVSVVQTGDEVEVF